MKIRFITSFLFLGAFAAATFGQESHLTEDVEIPLDDFPIMTVGYRIQLGAYNSENTALELKQNLQEKFGQKAHLHFEDGLWRIRLGDFADSVAYRNFIHTQLIPAGYSDAIMVEDKVPRSGESHPPPRTEPGYRIQIAALSDSENAKERAKDMSCSFPDLRPHVMMAHRLYKIQFGDFRLQAEAEAWKMEFEQIDSLQAIVVPAQVYGPAPPPPGQKTPEKDIFQYDD